MSLPEIKLFQPYVKTCWSNKLDPITVKEYQHEDSSNEYVRSADPTNPMESGRDE